MSEEVSLDQNQPTPSPEMQSLGPRVAGTPALSVRALLESGVHFGHQTKRWNPKMRPYIYGARNGIHIIDLDQTAKLFTRAFDFITETVARGGNVLFVGTKRQAQDIVREESVRAGMFFVNNRWLGGTLTNFRTIKQGLDRLRALERMAEDGTHEQLPKKEVIKLEKERARLEKYLGGLKNMGGLPHVVFVVDPSMEKIAVHEARKLNIPVVGITDTNCDPDQVDIVIPGNDDAIRSIKLITSRVADACIDGAVRRRDALAGRDDSGADGVSAARAARSGPEPTVYRGRPRGAGGGERGDRGGDRGGDHAGERGGDRGERGGDRGGERGDRGERRRN